jgi:hypothetical protein
MGSSEILIKISTYLEKSVINLYNFMIKENWCGACHASSSVLYVALSELGFKPVLCIGEVEGEGLYFDHSWIVLDGKIIDLSLSMTMLNGMSVCGLIVCGKDIDTNEAPNLQYGICGRGLEGEAKMVMNMPFVQYMNGFPYGKDGLWTIVAKVLEKEVDINQMRKKYKNTRRILIRKN